MSKFYYIKRDDGMTGPFSAGQITDMIENQIISADIMISENRIYWNTAAEILLKKKNVQVAVDVSEKKSQKEVYFPIEKEKTVEKKVEPVILKDAEDPEKFILPAEPPKTAASGNSVFIPDPISVTFSMAWNAPYYLKSMDFIIQYDNLHPNDRQSEALIFSMRTVILCAVAEFIMAMTLFALFLPQYFLPVLIALILIMLCQAILIFLENLCMAAIAHKKKLFEVPVLLMQLQMLSFSTFITAVPLSAAVSDMQDSTHIILKIIIYIFSIAAAIFSMGNMSLGLYRAMTDIFKFQTTSKISLIMLNILQWILLTTAIFKLASFFKSIL